MVRRQSRRSTVQPAGYAQGLSATIRSAHVAAACAALPGGGRRQKLTAAVQCMELTTRAAYSGRPDGGCPWQPGITCSAQCWALACNMPSAKDCCRPNEPMPVGYAPPVSCGASGPAKGKQSVLMPWLHTTACCAPASAGASPAPGRTRTCPSRVGCRSGRPNE